MDPSAEARKRERDNFTFTFKPKHMNYTIILYFTFSKCLCTLSFVPPFDKFTIYPPSRFHTLTKYLGLRYANCIENFSSNNTDINHASCTTRLIIIQYCVRTSVILGLSIFTLDLTFIVIQVMEGLASTFLYSSINNVGIPLLLRAEFNSYNYGQS